MNLHNQEFIATPYERGNGESTVSFIKDLPALHPDKKRVIIGDGARYHGREEVQAYWSPANPGLEEKDWKVTGLLLASNVPDQNPVEEVGLQGKNFLRRPFYEGSSRVLVESSTDMYH
jgi:DDE superfamily endonuclease